MKLYNLSRDCLLYANITHADSFITRSKGLLGQPKRVGLYLQTRWGIHTYGMRYPLTILVCDDTFRVKVIKKKLLPFRLYFWNPGWKHVFELPYRVYDVKQGDTITIIKDNNE